MNRIGFHYIPDTLHYQQIDLETWLPELKAMKARWLVLSAPPDRAIPEPFVRGILDANITPVLQFDLSPDQVPTQNDLSLLFKVYANWGVRYISLFQKPNLRSMWHTTNWSQIDLVERFLDIYLPLAENCLNAGLIPMFPPLEPGGDYWDTAFLRASLKGIKRRGYKHLLDKLVIGAIAQSRGKHLNWGAGGPERWPTSHPYHTPKDNEDQKGFRIFDWYNALVKSVLIDPLPIFLFEVGGSIDNDPGFIFHTEINMAIAQALVGEQNSGIEHIPDVVLGSAFWVLSAEQGTPHFSQAWFRGKEERLPIVQAFQDWVANKYPEENSKQKPTDDIAHYLLLPSYDGEILDAHIDLIRPYIKKYKPTIGFSYQEAGLAKRVTIFGDMNTIPNKKINQLRNAGCIVHQIDKNGIDIASL